MLVAGLTAASGLWVLIDMPGKQNESSWTVHDDLADLTS